MRYASFKQRILGGIIDFAILFVLLFVVGGFLSVTLFEQTINVQMAPFVIMESILFPIKVLINMSKSPTAYGDTSVYYSLLVIFFTIETLYYAVAEILPLKGTLGRQSTRAYIRKADGNKADLISICIRGFLKTLVRYLFAVPLLLILITNKRQSLHDYLTNTVVISNNLKLH